MREDVARRKTFEENISKFTSKMTNDIPEATVSMGDLATDTYTTFFSTTRALDPPVNNKKTSFVDHGKRPIDQPKKTTFKTNVNTNASSTKIPTHKAKIYPTPLTASPDVEILRL